jgi:predicted enzyme related to lactoylglutathione lyase
MTLLVRVPTVRFLAVAALAAGVAACTTVNRIDLSAMSFSDEPLIGKFVWYDLITEDLEATKAFYGELFGWDLVETKDFQGDDYVLARSGNIFVAGMVPVERPTDGSRLSRWLPYVSVNDVDTAVDRTVAGGGRVVVPATETNVGRVAAVVDPQGAVLGLARSAIGDPDDTTTAAGPGRVVWTELLADDQAAAASFYVDMVGYQANLIERRGGQYVLLKNGSATRGGILQNPTDDWKPAWLTYFGVSDPVAAAQRAESLGGRVLLAPTPEVREGTLALIADPSGAILALQKWPLEGGLQ